MPSTREGQCGFVDSHCGENRSWQEVCSDGIACRPILRGGRPAGNLRVREGAASRPLGRTLIAAVAVRVPPWGVRTVGAIEVVVGGLAVFFPSWPVAAALATLYAGFTAFLAYVLLAGLEVPSCGCLGERESPPTFVHVALNCFAVLVAAIVATHLVDPLPRFLVDLSYLAAPFMLGAVTIGYLAFLVVAYLPATFFAYRGPTVYAPRLVQEGVEDAR